MNIVKEIGIAGIADFKKSTLKIPRGVSYLYGKNMLAHGNGNAAGKSVFASAPSDIFYDTPIVGTRADKEKSGQRFIRFQRGKREIVIRSAYSGRSEKVAITVDGEEKKGRTTKITKSLLPRLWPITEQEYRTYGYLDASVPHPLVMGSTTERKAFFTSFFQLDRLDAERKVLAAYGSELKKVRARFNELDTTFKAVKADMLKKDQRLALESELESLEQQLTKLRKKSEQATKVQNLLEFEQWAGPKIKQLRKLVPDLDENTIQEEIKVRWKRIRVADEAKEKLTEWKLYRRQLEEYQQKIEGLDMSQPLEELARMSEEWVQANAGLAFVGRLEEPGARPERVEKPDQTREELALLQGKVRHMRDHARKFSKGLCSECGQEVEVPDPGKIKRLEREVETLAQAWAAYDSWTKKKEVWTRENEDYQERKAKRERLDQTLARTKKAHHLYKQRKDLVRPEKVEKPAEAEDTEPLRLEIQTLDFGAQHAQKIRQLSELTDEERGLKFDSEKLEQMQDQVSSSKTRLQVHNTVKGRASEMRTRLKALDRQLQDEEAVLFALEAYGDKAIKRMAVEAISERMMATVNQLAGLVFNGFRFEFVWDTQVKLLVHRNGKRPTDVRKLSGAERVLFTLILVFSLLMFVPSNKRLSLLILDEPCASFHEDTIALFHRLLPHLLQLIPSILVVTPKQYERFPGAVEYTVYRDETGACLKKGHPSEV